MMSDMNVSSAASTSAAYTSYEKTSAAKTEGTKAAEKTTESAAVYEKKEETKPATYSINKMSKEDRAALVSKMKAETENRKSQLASLVSKMLGGQANAYAKTDESLWKKLASGNFKASPADIAQAKQDISEDGYWGVKQTSQRLFDFAAALAGDDVEKMKEMQAAMEKGFAKARKTWGGELPGICQDTMSAAHKLFDDYYASKKSVEE